MPRSSADDIVSNEEYVVSAVLDFSLEGSVTDSIAVICSADRCHAEAFSTDDALGNGSGNAMTGMYSVA